MKFRNSLLAVIASFGLAAAANAAPITGQISLAGYVSAVGSVGMAAATGLNFQTGTGTADNGTAPGGLTSFGGGSGTFAGLTCANPGGGCGTIKDLASFTTSPPIASFLTLNANGISFDLASITDVTRIDGSNSINITANGTVHETGFDNTGGTFFLTAQGDNIVSFSATTLAANTSVPEPASLAILGGGLAAIGLIRRKKA